MASNLRSGHPVSVGLPGASTMTRVYLIFHTTMFRDAVGAILADYSDIHLAGVRPDNALSTEDLVGFRPDVILLEESVAGVAPTDAYRLLTSTIPCRLITLRLDADGMHVWSQTWHRSVHSGDLVEAIITAKGADRGADAS